MSTRKHSLLCALALIMLTLSVSAEEKEVDLFIQLGIQPMRGPSRSPNMALQDLEGNRVELESLRGKVIFLNFWATWCSPCKEEMSSMEALYQQFKGRGFVFLAIAVDYGGIKPVKQFIEKHRYTFPVLVDQKGKSLDLFNVKAIPTTLVIDKQGRILGKAIGPRNWRSPGAIALLEKLTVGQ